MKTKKSSAWAMGKDGQIQFSTMDKVVKERFKADTKWEHPVMAVAVMLLCGTLDFIMFRQLFGSFLYDNVWIQWFSIIGLLIGFDAAPIYLGMAAKKRKQGINTSKVVTGVFLFAFIVAFVINVILRIAMKDQVLPDLEKMATSVFGDVSMGIPVNERALPYALFTAVLPLVTSLVSFGISFMTFNPLKQKLRKLREEQYLLEKDMDSIKAVLADYEQDRDFQERVMEDDDRNYRIARAMAKEKAMMYLDYVRERIAEHLGTPSAANAMVSTQREKLEELFRTEEPGWEGYDKQGEDPGRYWNRPAAQGKETRCPLPDSRDGQPGRSADIVPDGPRLLGTA